MMSPAGGVLLTAGFWRVSWRWSILCGWLRSGSAQAVAGQIDAMGIVDEAIEDSVGERWNANQVVPQIDWGLTCDDERSLVITIFNDF